MSSYHDAPVGTSDTGMVPSGTLAPVSALPVGIAVAVFGLLVDTSGVGYVPLGVVGALLDTAYSMLDEVTVLEVFFRDCCFVSAVPIGTMAVAAVTVADILPIVPTIEWLRAVSICGDAEVMKPLVPP